MKMKSVQKCLKLATASLAWSVMAFSPVALGKEAENLSQRELQGYLQEAGLTKKSTVGEFWARTKTSYPSFIQKDLEQFVAKNKNRLMPEVNLVSSKATNGTMIPTLQVTENGKVNTVQFFGEKKKWAKINNVVLSEYDFKRVADVFSRLEVSDIKIKNEAEKYAESQSLVKKDSPVQMARDLSRFSGFPTMTPQLWKSLSMKERAGFIVTMRLMHHTALKVLNSNTKKTKSSAALENFYRAIFQEANAQKSRSSTTSKVGEQCVVAGYIGTYQNINNTNKTMSLACSVDKGIAGYGSKSGYDFVTKATATCSSSKGADYVACNPIIFGFPNSGPGGVSQPACIHKYTQDFSDATVSCDGQSRLTHGKLSDIPGGDKKYDGIKPREAQLKAIEDDQIADNYKLTEKFIEGVLASKDQTLLKAFKDGVWSQELESMLSGIQAGFKSEIDSAIGICEARLKSDPMQADPQQKDACDQLHRRYLFTEFFILKFRQKACDPAATYKGSFDKDKLDSIVTKVCECNETKVMVGLGAACAPVPPAAAIPTLPTVEVRAGKVVCEYPGVMASEMNDECLCNSTNNAPTEVVKNNTVNGETYPDSQAAESATYTCKESKFPWLLVGGAALLALFLFCKKDKSKSPPTPVTPVQPTPVCAPKVGVPPNCTCAPCAQGVNFEIINTVTCQCGPRVVTPIPVQCADGSTASSVAACPKCGDGSFKTLPSSGRANGCPDAVVPPEPPGNEGGSGNNCPAGGCSGGVN